MEKLPALLALVVLMGASMAIGIAANRAVEKGGFLKGFFLGNRGLGSWSMALTATVMSGGTFMGFPSLVYSYGWVVALWIASYMLVPLCTFGVLGKRIGQLSRLTGAITLPEFLRERFRSPALAIVASTVMVFILAVSLIAQFKGGALILQQVAPPVPGWTLSLGGQSPAFLSGLVIFTLVVVSYTVYGGFLAAVWTDVFQSVLMAIGVLILFPLALMKAGGLAAGTAAGIHAAGPGFVTGPGGAQDGRAFLPVGLAFSFFCMWSIAGMGQPATLLRLMAFSDTRILRQATLLLGVYNTLIYLPLVLIFICARAIFPTMEKPDEVMPRLALAVAHPLVAGIILSAPFGAVMATVSSFLVQISSAVVQDVYHRFINPAASEQTLRWASHLSITLIALVAAAGAIQSPKFLQAIIVFTGGSAACAFLFPAFMACFWPRATARGAIASMLGGVLTVVGLYLGGWLLGTDPKIGESGKYYPIYFLGVAPFVWGLLASAGFGVAVSLLDAPPEQSFQDRFFGPESA